MFDPKVSLVPSRQNDHMLVDASQQAPIGSSYPPYDPSNVSSWPSPAKVGLVYDHGHVPVPNSESKRYPSAALASALYQSSPPSGFTIPCIRSMDLDPSQDSYAPARSAERQTAPGGDPRRKRIRVAAACDECRDRKVKCDARKPVCSPCAKRDSFSRTCHWGPRRNQGGGLSQEFRRLQRRVEGLENQTRASTSPRGSLETRTVSLPDASTNASDARNNVVDAATGLTPGYQQAAGPDVEDSSIGSFTRQVQGIINRRSQQLEPGEHGHQQTLQSKRPPFQSDRSSFAPAISSRQRVEHLVELYWGTIDPLWPVMDKPDFESKYEALWTCTLPRDEEMVLTCILNAICALACIMDPMTPADERFSTADTYYQKVRATLGLQLIHRRSVPLVQCFLLLAQYLQGVNDPLQCWIFVSLAIRTAQSLGLDLSSTSAEVEGVHQRNLLRKVWHSCVLMDRALSMVFGRPTTISNQAASAVPLPRAHVDGAECSCWERAPSPKSTSVDYHFFIETLRLYELMSDILLSLYHASNKKTFEDDPFTEEFGNLGVKALKDILDTDGKLWLWSRRLPVHLQRTSPADNDSTFHSRQTNILWLRYYHVRILLLRPVLTRFCSKTNDRDGLLSGTLFGKLALECSIACVRTALESISLFDSAVRRKGQNAVDTVLPAPWFSILFVHTAATVLVPARGHPLMTAEISDEHIENAWKSAVKVLGCLEPYDQHATRCVNTLNALFNQVLQRHRNGNGGLQPLGAQGDLSRQSTAPPQQYQRSRPWHYYNEEWTKQNNMVCEGESAPQVPPGDFISRPYHPEHGASLPVLGNGQERNGDGNQLMAFTDGIATDALFDTQFFDMYDFGIDLNYLS